MKRFCSTVLILISFMLFGCTGEIRDPVVRSVSDKEAELTAEKIESEMSPEVVDNINVSLWASEELLSDAVGIDVDNQGRVFVSITERTAKF